MWMILVFFLASVQVEEVQENIKISDECGSGDTSVAALKRSSESCENEKGNISSQSQPSRRLHITISCD